MTPDGYEGIERGGDGGMMLARVILPDAAEPEWWSLRTAADAETLLRYYADQGVTHVVWSLYTMTQAARPEATTRPAGAHTVAQEQALPGMRIDSEADALIQWAVTNGHSYQVGGGTNHGKHRCGCGLEVRSRMAWLRHVKDARAAG